MSEITLTVEELKEKIADNYDPDLIVEVLQITTEELLDAFEDRLMDNRNKFIDLEEDNEIDENSQNRTE